jgi:hypothetical protein
MNDTPCPLCNFLIAQRRLAFVRREYEALAHYETEHEKHRETCEIINGSWYRSLWQSARIGTDTIQAEYEAS